MDSTSNSDSGSDSSHVSATPPRNPSQKPHLIHLRSSSISHGRSSSSQTAANSNRTFKGKQIRRQKHAENPRNEETVADHPCSPPSFPFKIIRATAPPPPSSSPGSLPAGYFSNIPFFSKLHERSNFSKFVENCDSKSSILEQECQTGASCSLSSIDLNNVSVLQKKNVKKRPNLIGDSMRSEPVKHRKLAAREGNFVRLNMNRFKHKFSGRKANRTYKNSSAFRKRNPYRNKKKTDDEIQTETNGCNAFTPEKFDMEAIEYAVAIARRNATEENLLKLLNLVYGYDSFREGQLEAIQSVLSGESTMLVLPTGLGKSLCYQLPAMILEGMIVVVCPLVALMIDQLKQLPPIIDGGLLSSSQDIEEASETLRGISDKTLKVLFVSPERLLSAEFLSLLSKSSPISLLVIDEAHCLSEWSHTFRPSYMRLKESFLSARLCVKCMLAMTSTATDMTLHAVMSSLAIPKKNVIHRTPLRDNLQLSISLSDNRMKDLLMLMKSVPFVDLESIIIYCKFQSETELICKFLVDNNINAKSFNSSIPAKDKRHTQELFFSNKIKVVVATVAFGMGINKKNIGAVIHYSLPESLEEYVQEIGRAGRDGRVSYCHLFLDEKTYYRSHSLMHSDGVDEYTVNKFLYQIFRSHTNSVMKISSMVKASTSQELDISEQVMLTLLSYLEMGEVQYLQVLPPTNVTASLCFHKTAPEVLSDKDIVIASIIKKSVTKHGQYVVDIPYVANTIGMTISEVLSHLRDLKFEGEITYELKDPAYCYTILNIPEDYCSLASELTEKLSTVAACRVAKLDSMFNAALYAAKLCEKKHGCSGSNHTPCLQKKIMDYFSGNDYSALLPTKISQSSPFLRADMKVFIQSNHCKFTPRAVARIMQGVGSPAYPSSTWSKTHFWGRYISVDFKTVMEAAKVELISLAGKGLD